MARRKPLTSMTVTKENQDGSLTVYPVRVVDTPEIAAALLAAAPDPNEVATVTTPNGWVVDEKIARAAGLL